MTGCLSQYDMCVGKKTASIQTFIFKVDNVAIDITGYTFFFTVKKPTDATTDDATDTTAVIKKDITSFPAQVGDDVGKFSLELSEADTDIDVGMYEYDIKYKTSASEKQSLIYGDFRLALSITQRS